MQQTKSHLNGLIRGRMRHHRSKDRC